MVNNAQLVSFLKKKQINASFTDKLKIAYRPLICPFEDLLPLVKPGDKVFDIGCGSGQFALLLAEFTPAAEIFGIEISDTLIQNARHLLAPYQEKTKTRFEVFNGSVFPLEMAQHDLIFLIDVVHHVPPAQQQKFLESIFKGAKSGARLIVKDIDKGSPFVYFNKMHDMVFAGEIGNEFSMNHLSETLSQLGFKIISAHKRRMYVYPHYTIIAEKP